MPKGDTYSRGDGSLARGVRKKRQRVCAVETGPKSCFVRVHRDGGSQDEGFDLIHEDQIRILQTLKAVYVRSDGRDDVVLMEGEELAGAADSSPVKWFDWYRIPIADGKTLQDITRVLRSRKLTDGPYWGTGHVSIQGTGQTGAEAVGRMKARQQSAQRARVETRLRSQMLPIELLARLGTCKFVDGKAVYAPLLMSSVPDCPRYESGKCQMGIDIDPQDMPGDSWSVLGERWAGFCQVANHLATQSKVEELSGVNNGAVERWNALRRWIREETREERPSTGFVAVDSKKPARGY